MLPENRSPRAPPPQPCFAAFLSYHISYGLSREILQNIYKSRKSSTFCPKCLRMKSGSLSFCRKSGGNSYKTLTVPKSPYSVKTVPETALVSGTVFYASVSGASSVSEGPLRIRSSALLFSCVERRRRLISACMASISAATRPRIFFSFTERVSNSSSRR